MSNSAITQTFFELFNLKEQFEVDLAQLEQTYFSLQQQHHPDRMAKATDAERLDSIKMSMFVNDAYNTLKSDLKRSEYLLKLQGIIINSDNATIKPEQSLLIYVMEQRKQLEEADTEEKITTLNDLVIKEKEHVIQKLHDLFNDQQWNEAAQLATKLQYLEKFKNELRLKREKGLQHDAT